MKNELFVSEFRELPGIEYFNFEEDFIEKNVRCIPMIVRFKMDAAGIKLKLAEWSKFKTEERIELAVMSAATDEELFLYYSHLSQLVENLPIARQQHLQLRRSQIGQICKTFL